MTLIDIGNIYKKQSNYPEEVLKNYLAALQIFEEIGNKKGAAESSGNIGSIYSMIGNYPEALNNYFYILKIQIEIKDTFNIAASYNNIGEIYKKQEEYTEALKNYRAALKFLKKAGMKGIKTRSNYSQ